MQESPHCQVHVQVWPNWPYKPSSSLNSMVIMADILISLILLINTFNVAGGSPLFCCSPRFPRQFDQRSKGIIQQLPIIQDRSSALVVFSQKIKPWSIYRFWYCKSNLAGIEKSHFLFLVILLMLCLFLVILLISLKISQIFCSWLS